MAQGWLIIERLENWEVDKAKNFAFFGVPERARKTAAEIAEGDLVFCYVSSGRSAFSDIRVVKEAGLQKMKIQSMTTISHSIFRPLRFWFCLLRNGSQ
jgi:hypothetical protein